MFCLHVSLCTPCIHDAHRGRRSVGSSGTDRVVGDSNLDLLEELSVFLPTEPYTWFYLLLLYECFACLYVHVPCMYLVPEEARRGCWTLWNGVIDGSKSQHKEARYQTLGYLKEQQIVLTTELSLQRLFSTFEGKRRFHYIA